MRLQGGQVSQKIRQQAVDFGPQGIGAKFLFGGGQPAGDNIVGIHLHQGNLQPFQDLVLPLPFKPQGVEIGDQGAGAAVLEENGQGFPGFALKQKKRDIMLLQPGSSLPPDHEA